MRRLVLFVLTIGMAAAVCAGAGQAPAQEPDPYRPTATIKDIMIAMVDPSADYMWDAVATEISAGGIRERAPRSDKEWSELRNRTVTLLEATNLLAIPGRHVAKAGDKPGNPQTEMPPEQIETLINANRPAWIVFSHGLHDATMKALAAADAKDARAFLLAGAGIDQACENCHVRFWYSAAKPTPAPKP